MGLSFLPLYSNSKFHFFPEAVFFGFGWVGGWVFGLGGWVRQINPPSPSHPTAAPVDKHIPGSNRACLHGFHCFQFSVIVPMFSVRWPKVQWLG